MKSRAGARCATLLALAAQPALAHHSLAAWFDQSETQEIEGVVTEVRWENPHVRFFVRVATPTGKQAIFEIETLSVSGVGRWGITEGSIKVGDRVRVAGAPSRRGLASIFVRNVLLPSGRELVFGGQPRYSQDASPGK
jgi:hypothetical protein